MTHTTSPAAGLAMTAVRGSGLLDERPVLDGEPFGAAYQLQFEAVSADTVAVCAVVAAARPALGAAADTPSTVATVKRVRLVVRLICSSGQARPLRASDLPCVSHRSRDGSES